MTEETEQGNREPEAPVGPGPGEQESQDPVPPGYADREEGETSEQGGAGENGEGTVTDSSGSQTHTSAQEGHPAGTGSRTDRDIGGPVAEEDAPESTGGAPGTKPGSGFEPHE
jgi:hypothetical protein